MWRYKNENRIIMVKMVFIWWKHEWNLVELMFLDGSEDSILFQC